MVTSPDLYVDAVSGSDANDGLTPATAIRTLAHLGVLLPRTALIDPTGGVLTIHVLTDLPNTDPLSLELTTSVDTVEVRFVGTPVTVRAGTLTAVTVLDEATGQPWEVTDAATTWPDDFQSRLDLTSGAAAGYRAWIAAATAVDAVRTSQWYLQDSLGAPAPGDAYAVRDLPDLALRALVTHRLSSDTIVTFDSFYVVVASDSATSTLLLTEQLVFDGCRIAFFLRDLAACSFVGCYDVGLSLEAGQPLVLAGLHDVIFAVSCYAVLGEEVMLSPGGFAIAEVYGGAAIQISALWSIDAVGLVVDAEGIAYMWPYGASATTGLFGAGNVDFGAVVDGTLRGYIFGPPFTDFQITGASGDLTMDGRTTMPAFDFGGVPPQYTSLRVLSWANLVAAIGAGGFGGVIGSPIGDATVHAT